MNGRRGKVNGPENGANCVGWVKAAQSAALPTNRDEPKPYEVFKRRWKEQKGGYQKDDTHPTWLPGYDGFIQRARTIDVSWFNARKMPAQLFEVEHTTDINNSLLKFTELQDFNAKFFIVADAARSREFLSKMQQAAFEALQKRVTFLNYEALSNWHSRMSIEQAHGVHL